MPPCDAPTARSAAAYVAGVTLLALLLRTLWLGNVFQSSDNCELAVKILRHPGYAWMAREPYGVLINLVVKLFVGTASTLGVTITEFWWKLPIALLGALQVPVGYLLLRGAGATDFGSRRGAELAAVLPLHVGQSRYLWGYEVLGLLLLSLALTALLAFFRRPSTRRGLLASLAVAGYLVSHGYVLPFVPMAALLIFLFAPGGGPGWGRFLRGCRLAGRHLVWLFPLLVAPLCYYPLRHTFEKPARLGFYLFDHLGGFIGNTGIFLGVLIVVAAGLALFDRHIRSKPAALLALGGAFYLAPLILGASPGITVVRGYMLVGTGLWVFGLALAADRIGGAHPRIVRVLLLACFLVTLWSTLETFFGRDELFDPNLVTVDRGEIPPDVGTKAAGYLIRTHAPQARLLALHRGIEPPGLYYYFCSGEADLRDKKSFFDLPLEAPAGAAARRPRDTRDAFDMFAPGADIVICEEAQLPYVRGSGMFDEKIVLCSEGRPRMWLFTRANLILPPIGATDVRTLNRAFDRDCAWKVSLR